MNKHGNHGSCCGSGSHGSGYYRGGHDCGCGHGGYGFRRFYTKEENRERLERYKEQLGKELASVEEHLKNM